MASVSDLSAVKFVPGDVLSYSPRWHHCRETTAIVREDGQAMDTFWRHTASDGALLNEEEMATATVRFNVNDYDLLDVYAQSSRSTWETYHPDDRERIPSQHGHQEALFVRKGAKPDLATQIANAKAKVTEAEEAVGSAQRRLECAREDLAKLEEKAA
jgi:hypothetical protein